MSDAVAERLRKVERIELRARKLADDLLPGPHRSLFRGSGLDFEELREYVPGDDMRSIDWNVTARTGHPYVKLYREEVNPHLECVAEGLRELRRQWREGQG